MELPAEEGAVAGRRIVDSKSEFSPPPAISVLPLQDENQKFFLMNITHHGHRPRSKYPGFRVMGAFPTIENLTSHVQQFFAQSDCSQFATAAHQLMCICTSTERQQDLEYNRCKIDKLVKLHDEEAAARERDFAQNVAERKTGSVGLSRYAKKTTEPSDTTFDESSVAGLKQTSSALSASACIAKQNFAVIIVLLDIESVPKEPLVAVLSVFPTEEEAATYAKYTASKQYPKCNIDVVDMYSWCFPENIDTDKIKEVYANDQLDTIMTARKENILQAERYTKWCSENNVEPEVTEIGQETATLEPVVTEIGQAALL